jgi:hypothetical protein
MKQSLRIAMVYYDHLNIEQGQYCKPVGLLLGIV